MMKRAANAGPLPFIFSVTVGSGQSFRLPTRSNGTYDCIIDWGDTTSNALTVWNAAGRSKTYAVGGTYDISISGVFAGWSVNNYSDRLKITEIKQWGVLKGWSLRGFFRCQNLTISATDIPDFSLNTDMSYCFRSCTSITTIPNIEFWDVSNVVSFGQLGANSGCFYDCTNFNQDISGWDVSSCTVFVGMFGLTTFNQDISGWNVGSGVNFDSMFDGATDFTSDLSSWNMSNATTVDAMFRGASSFNSDLSGWDVSNVTKFLGTFQNAVSFDSDLSSWDTSSAVTIRTMLMNCPLFDSDLSGWDVSNVTDFTNFLLSSSLSTTNYNATLISWAAQFVSPNEIISFGSSQYSAPPSAAASARDVLTNAPNNWVITDGGPI